MVRVVVSLVAAGLLIAACAQPSSPTSATAHLVGGSMQGVALSLSGKVTTLVGGDSSVGGLGSGFADGVQGTAKLNSPWGITTDGKDLYFTDRGNNRIRKITVATGYVSTIAGSGATGNLDASGTSATFNSPMGITCDGTNLYVADYSNNLIRKIVIATQVVTTIAGNDIGNATYTDGNSQASNLASTSSLTTDGTNLYFPDYVAHTIRKLDLTTNANVVSTIAGHIYGWGNRDGTGTAPQATSSDSYTGPLFKSPSEITTDGTNLYIFDEGNLIVRKLNIASGAVTTVAGDTTDGTANGTGPSAQFGYTGGMTTDGSNLYLSDAENYTMRKMTLGSAVVTTPVGTAGNYGTQDGTGASALLTYTAGIVSLGGKLYMCSRDDNRIVKIE